jgi:hypothetical protein
MDEKEPTQKTPEGLEIPVPKREDFFANLEKVAKKKPWWKRLWPRRSEE